MSFEPFLKEAYVPPRVRAERERRAHPDPRDAKRIDTTRLMQLNELAIQAYSNALSAPVPIGPDTVIVERNAVVRAKHDPARGNRAWGLFTRFE